MLQRACALLGGGWVLLDCKVRDEEVWHAASVWALLIWIPVFKPLLLDAGEIDVVRYFTRALLEVAVSLPVR
jgi:hypothetical protein